MADPALNVLNVTVLFNTNDLTDPINIILPSTVPPSPSGQILIQQGITMLVFEVVTLPQGSVPEAQFPTYPIEWFTYSGATVSGVTYHTPIAQPDCFQVHWYNPRQCTVVNTNTALFKNEHPFNVVVAYENKTYGTDPVIVNMPPDG